MRDRKSATFEIVWFLTGFFLFVILTDGAEAQSPAAYRFARAGDRIDVDEELHWRNWVYQNNLVRQVKSPMDSTGLFEFSSLGIKPKYLLARQNYVLDRGQFEYVDGVRFRGQTVTVTGQVDALSNQNAARNVGDGDLTTFWEPAESDFDADGLRNWQVLIDLGRTVFTDSIVVWFPQIESAGQLAVPLIPADADALADLTRELQAAFAAFGRRTSLDDLAAPNNLLDDEGNVLVEVGQSLLTAGQPLPASLAPLRRLNRLGISFVEIEGLEDQGDAPRLLTVEVSMGAQSGHSSSRSYRFDVVGRGTVVGRQRRLVFSLDPLAPADSDLDGVADFSGTFVHFVRLTIIDSDFDTKELLGEGTADLAVPPVDTAGGEHSTSPDVIGGLWERLS